MNQSPLRLFAAFLLILVASFSTSAKLITSTGTKPSTGNGNSGSPYEIRSAEELRWFVNYENTRHWYPNDYAVLRCDIDLSSICGPDKGSWIPLGYAEESGAKDHWYGNLDGNGCKITGLYIDGNDFSSSAVLGFCGTVTGATIKNLVVSGDIVNAPSTAGGLVGYIREDDCVITSCVSEVNLSTSAYNYMGGLIGYTAKASNTQITHCTYNGIINCPNGGGDNFAVGTLIGQCQGKGNINYCSSYSHPSNSQALPMIYRLTDNTGYTDISYNIANGSYLIKIVYDCYIRLQTNYFCRGVYCETFEKSDSEVGGNKTYTEEQFASGEACYNMNQDILTFLPLGTRSFYQNIGTDPIPYGVSFGHEVVQTAKNYTDCQNYTTIYNNTGLDTNKKHTFDAEHDHCTVCGEVLNPDYATKDSEGYFQIGTKAQMLWFIELCNTSSTPNYKMKLTADIDMEAVVQDPIHEFWGQIEGEGHVLNNVYISSNDQYVGLVGNLKLNPIPYISPGTIRNLTMNGFVQGKAYTQYVGAFAGKVEGSESRNASLYNVRNDCQVIYNGENPGAYNNTRIGGIVGQLDGSLIYGLNNGHVYDYVNRTQETDDGIAGIAGRKTKYSKMWGVINNGEVGSAYDSYKNRGAVANNVYGGNYEQVDVGYVKDIPPTLGGFYYSNIGDYSTGASQQAEALDRIRLASGEFCLSYFRNWGQKIGIDDAPFPVINDEHPKVYNKRYYYNCTDYSDYSNVNEDGEPQAHTYNAEHYCTRCYHLDPTFLPQDDDKAYIIETPAQWNAFAAVVNKAAAAGTVMSFASARLAADLSFDYSTGFTPLNTLNGKLDGAGHKMSFTYAAAPDNVVGTTSSYGSINNLYVDFPNEDVNIRLLCGTVNGTMSGCSVTKGAPTLTANGLVSDCAGQTDLSCEFRGCYKRVLIKLSDSNFRIYSGGEPGQETPYVVYTGDGMLGGEVAYALSHAEPEQECLWGQKLGTDAYPRIIFGLTPASDAFVAKTTTYSSVNPTGHEEYLNAGAVLEYAPGYYRVTADAESFPDMKSVTNFIVDNGDGSCSATAIEMDPSYAHYLPLQVEAGKFTISDTREFESATIVPVMFPVDMPLLNINGRVCLLDRYDSATKTLYFNSNLDIADLPANSPALVIAKGGSLLYENELYNVSVSPMNGANSFDSNDIRHFASYREENMGDDYVTVDGVKMACFYLDSDSKGDYHAYLNWADGGKEIAPLAAYVAFPASTAGMDEYTSGTATDELSVEFTGDTELKVSDTMEVDLMQFPYGVVPASQWEKAAHSPAGQIYFGNDPQGYAYADLSGYSRIELHGTPNQPYNVYFVGGDTKDALSYDASSLVPRQITLDKNGEYSLDLSAYRYVKLLQIISGDGEYVAYNASGSAFKTLADDAVTISGFGEIPDDYNGKAFYDATRVKSYLTLKLDNPNALVVAGDNIKGVANTLRRTNEREYGYTAESIGITDGFDFHYDCSVHCADVQFTSDNMVKNAPYFITILPFDVAPNEHIYKFDKYEDGNVCFKSTEQTIPAYTPIIVRVTDPSQVTVAGADLHRLAALGQFNLSAASAANDSKFGFATRTQSNVSLATDELSAFNIYTYDPVNNLFVLATDAFSLSPFRLIVALPKPAPAALPARSAAASASVSGCYSDGSDSMAGYSSANGAGFSMAEDSDYSSAGSAPSRAAAQVPQALGVKIDDDVTSVPGITIDGTDLRGDQPGYNLLGIPVDDTYRGIIIHNGQKHLRQ